MNDRDVSSRPAAPIRYVLGGLLVLSIAAGTALALASPGAGGARSPRMDGKILGTTRESGGDVMVALTPNRIEEGRFMVDIVVNTHTVNDLDRYDLTKITTLIHAGERVLAISAPKLAGHHNSGELVFPLKTLPDSLSIEIRGLNGPEIRVFKWP